MDGERRIFLGVKNYRENFVDSVSVTVLRPPAGLGITIVEIAGGQDNSLDIMVVLGLVEGGYTEGANVNILPSKSIACISVMIKEQQGLSDTQTIVSAVTECLGYDATVDTILNLPPPFTDDETMVINVK